MDEYISRDLVLADIEQTIEDSGCVNHEREIIDCVRYAKTADIVPVVRCKDCIHWGHDHDEGRWCWCSSLDIGTAPDFYCKDGERIDKEVQHDA